MAEPTPNRRARLATEDGRVFHGRAFGAAGTAGGEVVFNTSMTGYQEICTDPSYAGQIVTMTYPLIGNYGVNADDVESKQPRMAALVVRELPPRHSNYRATETLDEWLERSGVVGISGIDTRALTRSIRGEGAMRGVVSTDNALPDDRLVELARDVAAMAGADWVSRVRPDAAYDWAEGPGEWAHEPVHSGQGLHVVALDCGAKFNILRHLVARGVRVSVLPPETPAADITNLNPDGLFVSNGPGDPAAVDYAVESLKQNLGNIPTFGICLGFQLLSRALGATTYKLKFGHRGGNQPVMNLQTGRVEITSQNHGFAVDRESLERAGGVVTHVNLNDQTVEGFAHQSLPVFSVQYHPEASPGPHDAAYLFDAFVELMRTLKPLAPARLTELQRLRDKSPEDAEVSTTRGE